MIAQHIVTDATIERALKALAESPDFSEKLSWWLQQGNSIERWFQFEFAYQLDFLLRDTYTVRCEHQRKDMVIVSRDMTTQPVDQIPIMEAIELKLCGNWHVSGYQLGGIAKDIEKVKNYASENKVSAIALVIWVIATPRTSSVWHQWIAKQVSDQYGVADLAGLEKKIKDYPLNITPVGSTILQPAESFETLELCAYAYRQSPPA